MKSNNKNLIQIANNVRHYRAKLNISQEALAEKSGLHRTYIGQVERAEKNITIESLEKLATALNIEVIELFKQI